jgi:hypothetical protein
MSRHEAEWYFQFWAGDLKARWRMTDLCEELYLEGNQEGAGILWNACQYLGNRANYLATIESRGIGARRR